MPHYIKTGYWALEKNGYKGWLNLEDIIGGGGSSAVNVTKAEIDTLIAANSLVPGQTYIISGVDVPLYGGTTVVLQADTTNKLALAGHGIFYNPKYINSQATPENGYGIWNKYFPVIITNVVGGTFSNGDILTADNGAVANWLSNGLLEWVSGDWSLSTTVDNGFGVTANVGLAVLNQPGFPSYAIGDSVIWGGKHWINKTGVVGSSVDKYTLDSTNWDVVPFNSTDYNVQVDVIHYDYIHDMIVRRKDRYDNDVDGSWQSFFDWEDPSGYGYGNPIKDFQWGNYPDDFNTVDYYYIGVVANYVKDSYLDCLNFIGEYLWSNRLQVASISNTITDTFSSLSYNTLTNSYFDNNVLSSGNLNFNKLTTFCSISDNTLYAAQLESNILNNSSINANVLSSGGISYNTLSAGSNISINSLDSSSISYNTVNAASSINNNVMTSGSYIGNNSLVFSTFDFTPSGTLINVVITNIEARDSQILLDISTATIIYGSYSKQIFKRQDGTPRLGYYNNSDVFTIVNVNA